MEISLDLQGRLIHLEAMPPELESSPDAPRKVLPDWRSVFGAAGLDLAQFQSTEPLWNSLASADTRVAWIGKYPGTTFPLRIEAGGWRGKPVYFKLIGPWTKPNRMPATETTSATKIMHIVLAFAGTTLLAGAFLLYGVILGLIWAIFFELTYLSQVGDGGAPSLGSTVFLMGSRRVIGAWLWHLANSLQATLAFFFVMFILRVLLRKPWVAAAAFAALWAAIKLQGNPRWTIEAPGYLFVYGVVALMILRFGFITLATGIFVVDLLLNIPITTSPASWYMSGSLFVLATVIAITLWGGFSALGRQAVFRKQLFE